MEQMEIDYLLEGIPLEKQKDILLKLYLSLDDDKKQEYLLGYIFSSDKYLQLHSFLHELSIIGEMRKAIYDNRKSLSNISFYYNNLLNKCYSLALELDLSNSLELANLYTYLLWNGYFSKTKRNVFQFENRKLIHGFYSLDLMDGRGACINNSSMLKDFLIACGYRSICMSCSFDKKDICMDYEPEIEKKIKRLRLSTIIKLKFMNSSDGLDIGGNHVCTLIEDDNKLYLYDSTNFLLLDVCDLNTARVINGSGNFELHPYYSYSDSSSDMEDEVLGKFILAGLHKNIFVNIYKSPYDSNDYRLFWEKDLLLFRSNISLLEDFYADVKGDIDKITGVTKKIKRLI